MKFPSLIIFGFFTVIFFGGCSKQAESEKEGDANASEQPLPDDLKNSESYGLWEMILGDIGTGDFRGVSFGDSRDKVKITETFEIFEELPDQIGYTHDTKELETIDVYYHFTDQQMVDRMVVDIFLNGKSSADQLWQIADWYFKGRFGNPESTTETSKSWVKGDVKVVVENVSSGIDNGLKITISSAKPEAVAIRIIN